MFNKKTKLLVLIPSVILLLILKFAIDRSAGALPQALQLIINASLPVTGGLISVSSCSLLGDFTSTKNYATSHLLKRISEEPLRNFSVGFLVTAYLSLLRPPLAINVPFLPYGEWVILVLVVYVMYSTTRLSSEEFLVRSEGLGWKMHTQEVTRVTGIDLIRITSVMNQFVDQGVKEPLIVYLALHMQRLGETEEEILKTLGPLIEYHDERKPRLYFLIYPRASRKLAERNKKAREDFLNTLLSKIDGVHVE